MLPYAPATRMIIRVSPPTTPPAAGPAGPTAAEALRLGSGGTGIVEGPFVEGPVKKIKRIR